MPAYVAAAVAVIGLLSANASQNKQASMASDAAAHQREAQNEQRSAIASQQASDRRAQVREERVRRAKIMQGAENSGTAGSSGEIGALGSISTQFFSNIGTSLGGQRVASNISSQQQTAADMNFNAQIAGQQGARTQQGVQLAGNIFEQLNKGSTNIPTITPQEPGGYDSMAQDF